VTQPVSAAQSVSLSKSHDAHGVAAGRPVLDASVAAHVEPGELRSRVAIAAVAVVSLTAVLGRVTRPADGTSTHVLRPGRVACAEARDSAAVPTLRTRRHADTVRRPLCGS
jgi:hypothetical protein